MVLKRLGFFNILLVVENAIMDLSPLPLFCIEFLLGSKYEREITSFLLVFY